MSIGPGSSNLAADLKVEFGRTAGDYAQHRAGFPEEFFDRLKAIGTVRRGMDAVDLGTGTGSLARGLARLGCRVVGIDLSPAMLTEARRLDRETRVHVDYARARAEATGLRRSVFDLVTAGQCWHWFDRPRAAAEAHRLLRPGGSLVIAHFDWIPLPGNVADATEDLIRRHNPRWKMGGGLGIYPIWPRDLALAGFGRIQTFSFDVYVPYTHRAWRGRIRASAGVGASLEPDEIERFDDELSRMLAKRFPDEPMPVHHRVFAAIGVRY